MRVPEKPIPKEEQTSAPRGVRTEKKDFEKILEAVFTLDLNVKREKIIDFLQELGHDGFSILTNQSKETIVIDQSQTE